MPPFKYFIFFVLCFCSSIVAVAQNTNQFIQGVVKGNVYKEGTDSAVVNASVYYSGSMLGTTTNKTGSFELSAQSQSIPVIVSCIGYYSKTANYVSGKPLLVYLTPKIEELATVTVRPGGSGKDKTGSYGMSLKEMREIFINEFLGESDFAARCSITNIDDITLAYDKKKKLITASCDGPIMIKNDALGYTISYFLDRFAKTPDKVAFAGNYIFREQEQPTAEILANRETAYAGSRMQFIRSLWNQSTQQNGFKFFTKTSAQLKEKEILSVDTIGQKSITPGKQLIVVNDKSPRFLNELERGKESVYIDRNGYYGAGLVWSGAMGKQRVADLLPFEYESANEKKPLEATSSAKK